MKKIKLEGLTNETFVIKNKVVKKSSAPIDYFLDRQNENNFYQQSQNLSFILTPTKIVKKKNRWVSKMHYYPNTKTLSIKRINSEKMKTIISLIEELHLQKYDLKVFNPQTFLKLFTSKVGVIEQLKPWTKKINLIIKNYYAMSTPVVSHNDLIPENFLIKDGNIFLIDFEYVSLNHYLFDYASFINDSLTGTKRQEFVELLNLTHQELVKLKQLMQYQDYLWAHWAKYMYHETKQKIYWKLMKNKIEQLISALFWSE